MSKIDYTELIYLRSDEITRQPVSKVLPFLKIIAHQNSLRLNRKLEFEKALTILLLSVNYN